ncbi:MAG TPA: GAF domain-containing protein [Puia sp.]|jgi:light-regulated signal transduction histidine kinase (bacteriophytochrome)|nr:GAF domain-containing protein [Puia sp.]
MSSNPNYDSELCGKVPIHLINTVQPYAALLVLDRSSFAIIQLSENAEVIFGHPVQSLVDTALSTWLDLAAYSILQSLAAQSNSDRIPQIWTIRDKKYLSLVHIKEKYILVELDLDQYEEKDQRSFVSIYQEIKYSMALIGNATSTTEICSIAARELRRISGFDKIMIYRFDKEWNGYVIAEEKEEDMESYLGFTFPASDIPRQARELYLRNPYRFIPDRNYQPVKLYPVINPVTHSFIDLSDCNVRGIVAVHLEYLANMGVTASMSIRILNNDKLWGLIACHHKTARTLSFELCSIFELLSNVISSQIVSLYNKEKHNNFTREQQIWSRLIEQVYECNNIAQGLLNGETTVLQLFDATGAAMSRGGELTVQGTPPERSHIEELLLWLHTRRLTGIFHTDHLSGEFDHAATYMDVSSGLLAIPFNPEKDEYLLIFRPEVKKIIDWGGDPDGRIVFEKDGLNYHPRQSFKQWRQIVSGTSLPWEEEKMEVAGKLRSFLYEYSNK